MHQEITTLPKVDSYVCINSHTQNGEDVWKVSEHSSSNTVLLTRWGMAANTSMDQIMGNGRCPSYGIYKRVVQVKADGTCETFSETFQAS